MVTTLSLLVYVFMRISTSLFSGAVVLDVFLGWGVTTSAAIMVLATGAYVILGGLVVVIYTEVFQSVLLLLGSLILVVIGLIQVGGWSALVEASPPDFFHMIKPASDPTYPWIGVYGALFTYAGVWYWYASFFSPLPSSCSPFSLLSPSLEQGVPIKRACNELWVPRMYITADLAPSSPGYSRSHRCSSWYCLALSPALSSLRSSMTITPTQRTL